VGQIGDDLVTVYYAKTKPNKFLIIAKTTTNMQSTVTES